MNTRALSYYTKNSLISSSVGRERGLPSNHFTSGLEKGQIFHNLKKLVLKLPSFSMNESPIEIVNNSFSYDFKTNKERKIRCT